MKVAVHRQFSEASLSRCAMGHTMRFFLAILIAVGLVACTAIAFTSPQNGSTQSEVGANPLQVNVTESGIPDNVDYSYSDLYLDNSGLRASGNTYQLLPQSGMYYVPTGLHTLSTWAQDAWGITVSAATSFSIANCPLCYMSPVG